VEGTFSCAVVFMEGFLRELMEEADPLFDTALQRVEEITGQSQFFRSVAEAVGRGITLDILTPP
jgi:hypothetical protein